MTPTLEPLVDDLALIVDQAKWAHSHGHWKAGHGLAHEHGTDLSQTEAKRLEGPTYDIQVGDHAARVAYQKACIAVRLADVTFAAVLRDHGPQPDLHDLTIYSSSTELEQAARTAMSRAERIDDLTGWTPKINHLRKRLGAVVQDLSKAMDAGRADGIAHGEKMCRTCQIRPQAERANPDGTMRAHKTGECDTCAEFRHRNGVTRDPAKFDRDIAGPARAAQARRLARGDGWGAA